MKWSKQQKLNKNEVLLHMYIQVSRNLKRDISIISDEMEQATETKTVI